MPLIDAHVHVWTNDDARYPLAPGFKREDVRPITFPPEELFAHARPAGVERINLIQISHHGFDNSYLLDMIARHPAVFVGTAVIDPHAPDPDRVMTDLAAKRIRAFRIHPRLSKRPAEEWLRPAGYDVMFAAGARNRQAMSCLIEPNCLPELDRMCAAHPGTPVVIDHLCRIGLDGTIRGTDIDALCAMARHPNVTVKIGAFYALGAKQPPYLDLVPLIRRTIEAFGPERCMWESDSPFQVLGEHTYRASVELVRDRLDFLSAADRDWLLYKTAERFFFERSLP